VDEWQFLKNRTAAGDGAVWRSADGRRYRRTGNADVLAEAQHQHELVEAGYPVLEVIEVGESDEGCYFLERSAGAASLHELAIADSQRLGHVSDQVITQAVGLSTRLLEAQARNPLPGSARDPEWFSRAGFVGNVYEENPDLDTGRVRHAVERALRRLEQLPMVTSHLDYGLPNAYPYEVIDWQHCGPAPLGYDVYPMLEIVAFKGGNRGYRFSPAQRAEYLAGLDAASARLTGRPLSEFLGEFLWVKCFFFLALMRPADDSRPAKHMKWRYRRALFQAGLEQYESSGVIDTASFPTLAEFEQRSPATPSVTATTCWTDTG